MAPFEDPNVRAVIDTVHAARERPTKQAKPPSRELWHRLPGLALDRLLPTEVRCTAAVMILQAESVQRPGVMVALRTEDVAFVGERGMTLTRAHKVQDVQAKRQGRKEPTPVFPAPVSVIVLRTLRDERLVLSHPRSPLLPCARPTLTQYEAAVQRVWRAMSVPGELAATMTPHGLRRLGADLFLSRASSDRDDRPESRLGDLLALGPWSSLQPAMVYLPEWFIKHLGLQRMVKKERKDVSPDDD